VNHRGCGDYDYAKIVLAFHAVVDDTISAFFCLIGVNAQFCFAAPLCSAVESAVIQGYLLITLNTPNTFFELICG